MSEPDPPPPQSADAVEPVEDGSPHSRRHLALRVLAAILVAAASLAADRLWLQGDAARDTYGATVRTKVIDSALLDREMNVKVVVPKGAPAKDRGLVVFLHGRDENETSYLVDPMFEALAALRTRAPVIAFPDGGNSSYWHDRDSGDWGSYVLDEVIPALVERFDIDPGRIAIGGISMGGFGAYDLARLQPETFCAVAGHSPALWESAGETADGAFDDAADFETNDVIAIAGTGSGPYSDMKVWLDAGDDDPFLDGGAAFEKALRASGSSPVVKHPDGGHDSSYWNGNWSEYLGWYAHVLRKCGERRGGARPGEPGATSNSGPSSPEARRDGREGASPQPGPSDRRSRG